MMIVTLKLENAKVTDGTGGKVNTIFQALKAYSGTFSSNVLSLIRAGKNVKFVESNQKSQIIFD